MGFGGIGGNACISDSGYIAAATDQAQAIAVATAVDIAIQVVLHKKKRDATDSITDMIEGIASRKLALAKAVHEHATEFWPCEKDLVITTMSEQRHFAEYEVLGAEWTSATKDIHGTIMHKAYNKTAAKCSRFTNCDLYRLHYKTALFHEDVRSYAFRHAENRADALNDSRFNKQYAALGLGRGILTTINRYQQLAGQAGASAAETMTNSINSGLAAYGYVRGQILESGWGSGMRQQAIQKFEPRMRQAARRRQGADTGVGGTIPFRIGGGA